MPTIQISETDCAVKVVPWQQPANAQPTQQGLNLGLALQALSTTRTSNIIQAMEPMLAIVVIQLVSGAMTLNISAHNGTPNFGSPTEALAVSGTHMLCSNKIVLGRNDALVSGGNNMISIQQVVGSGGAATIARAALLLFGMFPKNAYGEITKQYHESSYSMNGFDTENGGVFDFLLA